MGFIRPIESLHPAVDAESAAAALISRKADRKLWNAIRAARRAAWIILHDAEDYAARRFISATDRGLQQSISERERNYRWSALRRALSANNPSSRILEISTYKLFKKSRQEGRHEGH